MCRDRKWEEYNKSAETKKVYVATKFSAGCQDKEEIVMTKKLLSRQIKQEEDKNYVVIRDILSQEEVKERQISLCCNIMKNIRQNLCRDRILSCRDTNYCNMEKLIETEEEL